VEIFFQQTRRAWPWLGALRFRNLLHKQPNTNFIKRKKSYKVSGKRPHGLGDANAMPKTGGLLKCSEAAE
jgi:hypothetical protein